MIMIHDWKLLRVEKRSIREYTFSQCFSFWCLVSPRSCFTPIVWSSSAASDIQLYTILPSFLQKLFRGLLCADLATYTPSEKVERFTKSMHNVLRPNIAKRRLCIWSDIKRNNWINEWSLKNFYFWVWSHEENTFRMWKTSSLEFEDSDMCLHLYKYLFENKNDINARSLIQSTRKVTSSCSFTDGSSKNTFFSLELLEMHAILRKYLKCPLGEWDRNDDVYFLMHISSPSHKISS